MAGSDPGNMIRNTIRDLISKTSRNRDRNIIRKVSGKMSVKEAVILLGFTINDARRATITSSPIT